MARTAKIKHICDKCKKDHEELNAYKPYIPGDLKWYCKECFEKVKKK